jgi:hypothetical protein
VSGRKLTLPPRRCQQQSPFRFPYLEVILTAQTTKREGESDVSPWIPFACAPVFCVICISVSDEGETHSNKWPAAALTKISDVREAPTDLKAGDSVHLAE